MFWMIKLVETIMDVSGAVPGVGPVELTSKGWLRALINNWRTELDLTVRITVPVYIRDIIKRQLSDFLKIFIFLQYCNSNN